MIPPGAARPYFLAHSAFVQMGISTFCRMDGCGPFSRRLPHPATVATWPLYDRDCCEGEVGRQIGWISLVKGTGSLNVSMATSLCWERELLFEYIDGNYVKSFRKIDWILLPGC